MSIESFSSKNLWKKNTKNPWCFSINHHRNTRKISWLNSCKWILRICSAKQSMEKKISQKRLKNILDEFYPNLYLIALTNFRRNFKNFISLSKFPKKSGTLSKDFMKERPMVFWKHFRKKALRNSLEARILRESPDEIPYGMPRNLWMNFYIFQKVFGKNAWRYSRGIREEIPDKILRGK